jgi:ParB family chromosome partitioning protein
MAANEIAAKKLSVREAERLAARGAGRGKAEGAGRAPAKSREIARLESRLADHLTAPVEIRVKKRTRRGEQGEIAIRFDSLDELNGVLEKLGLQEGG